MIMIMIMMKLGWEEVYGVLIFRPGTNNNDDNNNNDNSLDSTITFEWGVGRLCQRHFLCFPLVISCLSARGGRVEFPIGLSRIQHLLSLFGS